MGLLRLFRRQGRPKRKIFAYHDGVRRRWADPIAIWRAIESDPEFDPTRHFGEMDRGEGESFEIAGRMARRAFSLPAYDDRTGKGLTEFEAMSLLWRFIAYSEELKKNIEPPPTAPSPTDLPASPASGSQVTSSSSASGSISTGPNIDTKTE